MGSGSIDDGDPAAVRAGRVGLVRPCTFVPCAARVPMAAFPTMASYLRLPPLPAGPAMLTVGVIDTGIVLNDNRHSGHAHPWLADRVDFDSSDEDRLPDDGGMLSNSAGHGTLVSGIVLGEAPLAKVKVVRALSGPAGGLGGRAEIHDGDVARAITALAAPPGPQATPVKLINLSFCGDVQADPKAPPEIAKALDQLPDDVVVVAAAGNFGDDTKVWPAAFDRVIAVGAVEPSHLCPTPFTSRGEWVTAYAPGRSMVGPFCWHDEASVPTPTVSPQHFQGWAQGTGTSFAAAVVTGRIAQLAIEAGISEELAARRLLDESPLVRVDRLERPYVGSGAKVLLG